MDWDGNEGMPCRLQRGSNEGIVVSGSRTCMGFAIDLVHVYFSIGYILYCGISDGGKLHDGILSPTSDLRTSWDGDELFSLGNFATRHYSFVKLDLGGG